VHALDIEGNLPMPVLTQIQTESAIAYDALNAPDLLTSLPLSLGLPSRSAYDAELVERVALFQKQLGLQVDGKIGRSTREAIGETLPLLDARPLWPAAGASEAQKFDHYERLCRSLKQSLPAAHPLLIGVRGVELNAHSTHPVISKPAYDDTFVLLNPLGGKRVLEFRGATHPYQKVMGSGVDANLDGLPDVGTIRPGRYVMERQKTDPAHPKLWVKRGVDDPVVPTWRDTDHNGTIGGTEKQASETHQRGQQTRPDMGDFATEVLLHPGFDATQANGRRYSSIGCQTAALVDVQAVAAFPKLDYLLLDARDALASLATGSGAIA
jgi:hypothetical protein